MFCGYYYTRSLLPSYHCYFPAYPEQLPLLSQVFEARPLWVWGQVTLT